MRFESHDTVAEGAGARAQQKVVQQKTSRLGMKNENVVGFARTMLTPP
jgi:hypothetical protein